MGYLTEAFYSQKKSNERRCWYLTETLDFYFEGGNDLATLKSELPESVLKKSTLICPLPNLIVLIVREDTLGVTLMLHWGKFFAMLSWLWTLQFPGKYLFFIYSSSKAMLHAAE